MTDFSNLNILTGAGLAALVAAIGIFWSQAKGFARYLSGFLLLQKTIQGGLSTPVVLHVRANYKKLPSGISRYYGILGQVDNNPLYSYIPFEMPNGISLWFGRRGLFVVNAGRDITLLSIRGVSNPQGLISDALEFSDKLRDLNREIGEGNFYVARVLGTAGESVSSALGHSYTGNNSPNSKSTTLTESPEVSLGSWEIPDIQIDKSFMYDADRYVKNKKNVDPFKGLFFNQEIMQLVEDLKNWYTRRDWYQARGIPWRIGTLLHGPGGTGKSSLSKAIAEVLGLPLYQFYLNTLTDREFVNKWDELRPPCVVALEDFDTVFHGRESATIHKSLSFECVLNQISGISSVNGIMLIVTTNHLNHIDAALGQLDANGRPTRPGRIDRVIHMGNTDYEQRHAIARYVLDGCAEDLIEKIINEGINTTAAQFQSMCIHAALERLTFSEKSRT
jgi:ATP-dependent 26S proteasome regulatory subunit